MENGFEAQGVDLDDGMLAACHERGLQVARDDAISFLKGLPDSSQLIVSGFHIAEHLPFPVLHTLMQEALRVLKPGGLLILETPNPESIRVGTSSFYLDPTHEKPLPYELLSFLPEYHGFARVKVVRLQEDPELRASESASLGSVLTGVSPDYAIVAQKRAEDAVMEATGKAFDIEYGLSLESLIYRFDGQVATFAPRLTAVETHLASCDAQFNTINNNIASLDAQLAAHTKGIADLLQAFSNATAAQEAQAAWFDQRISDLDARLQTAMACQEERHHQLAGLYNSTSWRITAPLRSTVSVLKWLANGTTAWITLKPESRPRRLVKTGIVELVGQIQKHPRLAGFAKRVVGRFPRASNRLKSVMYQHRAECISLESGISDDDPVDLFMEPQSVRLVFRRLMHARKNQEPLSHAPQEQSNIPSPSGLQGDSRPRLAYVSPLPPAQTGIADYSAELLPELVRYYAIDVIVAQGEVSDPWIKEHCAIRDQEWFERHAHSYDRIIYHVGNSLFHLHMLPLLERYPGVVVLHDFYQSGLMAHLEVQCGWKGVWTRALYHAHGYNAVRERFAPGNVLETVHKYPVSLTVLENAQGVIVHSRYSQQLAQKYYGDSLPDDWAVIPLPRLLPQNLDRKAHREALGLGEDDFLLCSFGILVETKLNLRLLEAWLQTPLARDSRCHLVFVGQDSQDEYCVKLRKAINASPARTRIRITGFAPAEVYKQYLQAADAAVQLRAFSRGETSAAVLDCMAHAVPTIANANGSMAELPQDTVLLLPDEFSTSDLADAIMMLRENPERRQELSEKAHAAVMNSHSPQHVASRYHVAIEEFTRTAPPSHNAHVLADRASVLGSAPPEDAAWLALAREIAKEGPVRKGLRQLFFDVSVLAQNDYKTGIQRVVRAQLLALLSNPPAGFRIEPVRLSHAHGQWHYRYARGYMSELLDFPGDILEDDPVEVASGDIFYMPDYWTDGVAHATQAGIYSDWRARGIKTTFMVYDMLPLLRPEFFPDYAPEMHSKWLLSLTDSADRLICISHAVAEETREWLRAHKPEALEHLEITALHLGADIDATAPTKGLPENAQSILEALASRPSYLMVGTIEPRKGYLQTLAAFERLWDEGIDANLVIVGGEGWKAVSQAQRRTIPQIVKKLRRHPEAGKRLFWLEGISDEYLEKVYATCVCLIAASEGEGFGLPLIEAARHKIPILARDIPVFREVAGTHASYFTGSEPDDLARAVRGWQRLRAENRLPESDTMPWLTWAENAEALKGILLQDSQPQIQRSEEKRAAIG
jgi:glycosyltransferase involved in cell wall biosynthesis